LGEDVPGLRNRDDSRSQRNFCPDQALWVPASAESLVVGGDHWDQPICAVEFTNEFLRELSVAAQLGEVFVGEVAEPRQQIRVQRQLADVVKRGCAPEIGQVVTGKAHLVPGGDRVDGHSFGMVGLTRHVDIKRLQKGTHTVAFLVSE
jgi:hypothetical protein